MSEGRGAGEVAIKESRRLVGGAREIGARVWMCVCLVWVCMCVVWVWMCVDVVCVCVCVWMCVGVVCV